MERDLAKRFVTKDGNTRINIYREEYAENPRYNTDEPLHCEDWSGDYSIMTNHERETKSSSACELIRYLLERYGDKKAIISVLKENANAEKHRDGDEALMYVASRHEWVLFYWIEPWKDYTGETHGNCWGEEWSWAYRLDKITVDEIVEHLSDDMIDEFADKKYFTDGIKIGSYTFDYYGGISFSDSFSADSEGICWLEKDEFLKYSGCKEEYWQSKSLTEIEWLLGELEAWSNNEVYGFVVEDCIKSNIHKEYTNSDRDDECYEHEEWEESDSCWGYYGDIDEVKVSMFDQAGLDINEFEEENV